WKVIGVQARAIFFPLWVNVRFWQAYDKSLSTLIDEFADDVAVRYPVGARPPGQQQISGAGNSARYGRAPDGTEALLLADHDVPPRLVVRGPAGDVRLSMNLIDVVPPRRLTIGEPMIAGPPSFVADASALYFAALDVEATFQATRLVRVDVASGRLTVLHPDLRGGGGSISPDGRTYVFSRADGDRHDLAVLDIASGAVRVLGQSAPGSFISLPRFSPDGKRIVATVFDTRSFRVRVFDAATGAILSTVTDGARPVHDASWAGNDAVVYLSASQPGAGFQVYLNDLRSGASRQVTHAPYLAFQPQVARGTLRFLNREGFGWTLDEVALNPLNASGVVGLNRTFATATATATAATTAPRATNVAMLVPTPAVRQAAAGSAPTAGESSAVGEPSSTPAAAPADAASAGDHAASGPPDGSVGYPPPIPPPPQPAPPPAPPPPVAGTGVAPWPAPYWVPAPPVLPLVLSDEPYRSTDHLLVPLLHGIEFAALGRQALAVGVILAGNDRLQFHRWFVSGVYQFASARAGYGGTFGYSNHHLAPFTLSLTGLFLNLRDTPPQVSDAPAP
ncbi:MAG: hypothetical protein ABUS79_31860, partial [Pseudomonadota bacterium]